MTISMFKRFGCRYWRMLMLGMLPLMFTACVSPILYRIQVEDHHASAILGLVPNKLNYVILKDSVAVFQNGGPMLWKLRHDSVRQVEKVCDNITLLKEVARIDNILKPNFVYANIVPSFVRSNPFMSGDKYIPIKEGANNDTILNLLKECLKGDFEYRAAYNIYRGCRKDNDSLGIFTSNKRYRKYRMINGIESYRFSLSKKKDRYSFKFKTYYPVTTENGDTVGPLWLQGCLPQGFTRVTEASPNDFMFEYGNGAIVWIHADPNGNAQNNNYPQDITEDDAREFIRSNFPETGLYGGLREIKNKLMSKNKGCEINLRTDRSTIIAKGIDNKDYNMFSSMLRSSFIEKDQRFMMELFIIVMRDPDIFDEYFLDMYGDFFSRVHLGMGKNDYLRAIRAYSDWPDRHNIKIDEE